MSDQTEPTLAEPDQAQVNLPPALGGPDTIRDNILSLERVLNSARLVERVVEICLRADLEAELLSTVNELATLVDKDGNVLGVEEAALGEPKVARAEGLKVKANQIREEMAAETFTVRFRALPDDQWRAFEKQHRKPDGSLKDLDEYNAQLIAATAIAPAMTVDEVKQLGGTLSGRQMTALANGAFKSCTEGGLDVPKLPSFSLVQKPEQQ